MKKEVTSARRRTVVALLTVSALGAAVAPGQHYGIRDLGTLSGGFNSDAFALNSLGQTAGVGSVSGANFHGFYDAGSGMTDIPPLAGLQSHAFDLNDGGQVAGAYWDIGDNVTHGLLWQSGASTDLGAIAPRGINAAGVVVGTISFNDAAFGWVDHAARWQAGTISDLGTLGGHFSFANAIGDDGRIVGLSFNASDTNRRATLWQGGVPIDLGTLGGMHSQAYDINSLGHVVGVADTVAGEAHAFLFTLGAGGNVTSRTDLGDLNGSDSYAYGINSSDVIVGTSDGVAFVWQAGVMTELTTLLSPGLSWRLDAAREVNDAGQIVGTGLHEGQPRAFLMTPYAVGDLNCDGAVDFADINPFVIALLQGPADYIAAHPTCNYLNADVSGDGIVSFNDINPFVVLLLGPL